MANMANLQKATISVHKDDEAKSSALKGKKSKAKPAGGQNPPDGVAFMFNPEAVRVTKTLKPKENKGAGQDTPELQFTSGNAATVEFGEILFDGFDQRINVHDVYVMPLEALIHVDEELHRPPLVFFSWGSGWGEGGGKINTGLYFITGLDVNYTMFLPDGTPVRCKCKLTLTQAPSKSDRKSPDTAHVYLVSRSDTLQSIAGKEYDDPSQWRRIANANGIDDPLNLMPGHRLLIPPILK